MDPYPAHPVTLTDPDIQFVISSAGMPASSPAATGARPQRRSYGRVMQPSSCPCARDIGLFGCVHEVLGRDPLQYWPRLLAHCRVAPGSCVSDHTLRQGISFRGSEPGSAPEADPRPRDVGSARGPRPHAAATWRYVKGASSAPRTGGMQKSTVSARTGSGCAGHGN